MDVSRSRWLLPAVMYATILALSSVPADTIDDLGLPGGLSYLGHAVEYGALGAALAWALGAGTAERRRVLATVAIVAVVVLVLGGIDELYQSTVPGRDTSLVDLTVDVAAAGVAAWGIFRWRG